MNSDDQNKNCTENIVIYLFKRLNRVPFDFDHVLKMIIDHKNKNVSKIILLSQSILNQSR